MGNRPGIHPQVLHRRMKSVTYFGRSVPGGGGQGVNILQPHSHDGCARGHEKKGGRRRIDIESFSSMRDALSLYQKKISMGYENGMLRETTSEEKLKTRQWASLNC